MQTNVQMVLVDGNDLEQLSILEVPAVLHSACSLSRLVGNRESEAVDIRPGMRLAADADERGAAIGRPSDRWSSGGRLEWRDGLSWVRVRDSA